MAGPERRSRLISEREKRVIAYHEGGHALVAHTLPNTDPVHKVSIIPRGRALGYTLTLPTEDRFLVTRSELVDELAMLLGGRTAEELIFADPTTGAQNDIDRATDHRPADGHRVRDERRLGPMRFGHPQGEVFLGRDFTCTPDYSEEIAAEHRRRGARAHRRRARRPRRRSWPSNRAVLDRLADALIEHETLEAEQVQEVFADVRMWDDDAMPTSAPASARGRAAASATALQPRAVRPDPRTGGTRDRPEPLHSVPEVGGGDADRPRPDRASSTRDPRGDR